MASEDMLAEEAPAAGLRKVRTEERSGRAALFAAGACVLGFLAFIAGQLGWWTLVAGPAYLCAIAAAVMLARGRAKALLAVAIATASMGVIVGLVKLTGLA